jgi:serine/threonine protein kinase
MTGGKLYGEGSYGVVFGDPRIPCEDEDFDKNNILQKNEVSKTMFDDTSTSSTQATIELIHNRFGNRTELDKYVIIPSRICNVNHAQIKEHPSVYTSQWRNNKDIDKYTIQTISLKGTRDLTKDLNSKLSINQINTFVVGMNNVIKGIQLLHQKKIIHGDIKLGNVVTMGGTDFRIIDTDELKPYDSPDKIDRDLFYANFMYVIWPLATVCTVELNSRPSVAMMKETIDNNINSPFNRTKMSALKDRYSLVYRKIKDIRPNFEETLLAEKDPYNTDVLNRISEKSNTDALYTYIDRYSFGIALMDVLLKYFSFNVATATNPIVSKLLDIIEKCCFIEHGFTVTTDEIAADYERLVSEIVIKKAKSTTIKTCSPGKTLNPATGRCVKNKTAKTCSPGKTLNPATGRCVKNKTAKTCSPGKTLNPATGRCVKVKILK